MILYSLVNGELLVSPLLFVLPCCHFLCVLSILLCLSVFCFLLVLLFVASQ